MVELDRLSSVTAPERIAADRDPYTSFDMVGDSILLDTIPGRAALDFNDPSFSIDQNFRITDDNWKFLTEGLDPSYHMIFSQARNADHAVYLRDKALDLQERERRIAENGWSGFATRLIVGTLDPGQIALDAAGIALTGGVGTALNQAQRARRASRIGVSLGATTYAGQSYIEASDPTMEHHHTLLATIMAASLGGTASYYLDRRFARAVKTAADEQEARAAVLRGEDTTDYGEAVMSTGSPVDNVDMEDIVAVMPEAVEDSAKIARDAVRRAQKPQRSPEANKLGEAAETPGAARGDAEDALEGTPENAQVSADEPAVRVEEPEESLVDILGDPRNAYRMLGENEFDTLLIQMTNKQLRDVIDRARAAGITTSKPQAKANKSTLMREVRDIARKAPEPAEKVSKRAAREENITTRATEPSGDYLLTSLKKAEASQDYDSGMRLLSEVKKLPKAEVHRIATEVSGFPPRKSATKTEALKQIQDVFTGIRRRAAKQKVFDSAFAAFDEAQVPPRNTVADAYKALDPADAEAVNRLASVIRGLNASEAKTLARAVLRSSPKSGKAAREAVLRELSARSKSAQDGQRIAGAAPKSQDAGAARAPRDPDMPLSLEELSDIPTARLRAEDAESAPTAFTRLRKIPVKFDVPVVSPVVRALAGKRGGKLVDTELDLTKIPGLQNGIPFRFDMVGFVKSSNNPIVRKLGGLMMEDGVGNVGHQTSSFNAWFRARREYNQYAGRLYQIVRGATNWKNPYSSTSGGTGSIYKWMQQDPQNRTFEQFFEEVGLAVRAGRGSGASKEVNEVADAYREIMREILQKAKDAGVRGADEVLENDDYLSRVFSNQKIDDFITRYGQDNTQGLASLYRLVADAMIAGSDELDTESALTLARAYIHTVRSSQYGTRGQMMFSSANREILENYLRDTAQIDAPEIDRLMRALDNTQSQQGKTARMKRRASLDENTSIAVYDRATGEIVRVSFSDILENNAEVIFHQYLRQMLGEIEMARILDNFRVRDPLTGELGDRPSFDTLVENIKSIEADNPGVSNSRLERELEILRVFNKAVHGNPLHDETLVGSRGENILQLLRGYNFFRVMNQVGFAQLAELGNSLGMVGRGADALWPSVKGVWSRAADGTLSDELLSELELATSLTQERLRRPFTVRMRDVGGFEGQASQGLHGLSRRMQNFTADASGMMPINQALRAFNLAGWTQKWARMALENRPLDNVARYRWLGWDDGTWASISENIRKHATVDTIDMKWGIGGQRQVIRRLNLSKWDIDARASFEMGLDRMTNRVVQQQSPGQLMHWMTTELGQTAIQFRTFSISAYQQQLIQGLYEFDHNVWNAWRVSMTIGALAYMSQTYLRSLAMSDGEEYLRERLGTDDEGTAVEKIMKAGFMRAGFASILPGAFDTVQTTFLGFDPYFSYGRSTGLASDFLMGNPTVDLLNNTFRAVGGASSSVASSEYDYSQQDARALRTILPFQNMLGIQQALNAVQTHPGLPTTSK